MKKILNLAIVLLLIGCLLCGCSKNVDDEYAEVSSNNNSSIVGTWLYVDMDDSGNAEIENHYFVFYEDGTMIELYKDYDEFDTNEYTYVYENGVIRTENELASNLNTDTLHSGIIYFNDGNDCLKKISDDQYAISDFANVSAIDFIG